ncbi:AAA family ATPase [Hydrogenophaga soli]
MSRSNALIADVDAPATPPLTEVWLLGGLRLERQGVTLPGLAYRKAWGLLAYLLVEKGWHARAHLADLLGIRSAGHLRQLLSSLRQALDTPGAPPLLQVDGARIRLHPDAALWADVNELSCPLPPCPHHAREAWCPSCLERLATQAACHQGEFLSGLDLPGAPNFEDWCQGQRETFKLHAVGLHEQLCRGHEQSGNLMQALTHARQVVALDPWNETGQRHLMQLLARQGQPAAAVAQFDAFRKRLLDDLGVHPQDATRQLCQRIQAGEWNALATEPAPSPATWPAQVAERRLVTVVYVELSLPGEDDLETIAEALHVPQAHAESLIQQRGGHVVQRHGGGVLAYFGYPLARENAAHMAVGTALRIRDSLPTGLGLRIGIHSGFMVVHPHAPSPDVAGVTSGVAIRIRQDAPPGSVLITEATEHLVRGYFEVMPHPIPPAQGANQVPRLYGVRRASGAQTRLDAVPQSTPLIGRQADLVRLHALWQDPNPDSPRTLLLQGEAGIGKSRLVRAFAHTLTVAGVPVVELQCSAEHDQSPLHPVRTWLQRWLDVHPLGSLEDTGRRLAQALQTSALQGHDSAQALAEWLHENPDQPPHSPPAIRDRTSVFEALTALLHHHTGRRGLLLVEDLHWCDPSTREWLQEHVIAQTHGQAMTLLTSRPVTKTVQAVAPAQVWDIAPLDTHAMATLVQAHGALPEETVQQIVSRADGIALFAEELALMAHQPQTRPSAYAPSLPLSLQDLLHSRLDAVGEARRTAQLAATLGRTFAQDVLVAAADAPEKTIGTHLSVLQAHGLLQPLGPHQWQFKHALVQAAAYETQTRSQRKVAHAAIAKALSDIRPQGPHAAPEVLALHLREADDLEPSLELWLQAGRQAMQQSAHTEALSHLNAATALLPHIADEAVRQRLAFSVHKLKGQALVALEGYGAASAHQCFVQAMALANWATSPTEVFPAQYGLWLGGASNQHALASLDMVALLDKLAQATGRAEHRIVTHYAYGNNLFWLGRFEQARHHLQQAAADHPGVTSASLMPITGEDTQVLARSFLAWTLCFLGEGDAAQDHMAQALRQAHANEHVHTLCFALTFAAVLHRHLDEPHKVLTHTQAVVSLAQRHRLGQWAASATMLEGWARVRLGQADALALVQQGAGAGSSAHRSIETTYGSFLLDALHHLGLHLQALECAKYLLQACQRNEDHYLEAEFLRVQALCHRSLGQTDGLRTCATLEQARALAMSQGALLLVQRIDRDLGSAGH